MNLHLPSLFLAVASAVVVTPASAALAVTNPPSTTTTIAAGDDFATQVIGNAWDMNSSADFDPGESGGLNSQTISSGTYSATIAVTSGANPGGNFWPLSPGWGKATLPHWSGELYPIDTSHYHNFTIKLHDSGGTGTQPVRAVFFRDGDSVPDFSIGSSFFKYIPQQGQWTIVSWDLLTETYGTPYHPWTTYPLVHGMRFDFATDSNAGTLGANVQVAWIRVTTPNSYNVTWSDSPVGSYFVTAIDSGGTRFQFNTTAVNGTSYSADLALLAPDDYHIEVKNGGTNATATSGILHINAPPQIKIDEPSIRGEQTRNYAFASSGHQWGPFSAADFSQVNNFASYNFTSLPGSFYGRAANQDPQLWFTTNQSIDTNLYRSVCVIAQVFGPRDVGAGSVARWFWGVVSTSMSGTDGFVLYNNNVPNEYCFADLKQTPLDPLSPPAPWTGTQNYFRFDPHEFAVDNTDAAHPSQCPSSPSPSNCHDVRLDSVILSPFAEANPDYLVQWTLAPDPDYSGGGSTQIFLDPDKTFGNGNEIRVAVLAYTLGANQFKFVAGKNIANGTYNLAVQADDGVNTVTQYAGGPIIVRNDDVIFRDGFDPSL